MLCDELATNPFLRLAEKVSLTVRDRVMLTCSVQGAHALVVPGTVLRFFSGFACTSRSAAARRPTKATASVFLLLLFLSRICGSLVLSSVLHILSCFVSDKHKIESPIPATCIITVRPLSTHSAQNVCSRENKFLLREPWVLCLHPHRKAHSHVELMRQPRAAHCYKRHSLSCSFLPAKLCLIKL